MATLHPAIVANALLSAGLKAGYRFDHMQLQVLVYFTHVWSLALKGESLLSERPQAWQSGPIFETVFYRLQHWGSSLIKGHLEVFDPARGCNGPMVPGTVARHVWDIVDQVIARYGHLEVEQLAVLVRVAGGPWETARSKRLQFIADNDVIRFYEPLLQQGHELHVLAKV